MLTLDPAKRIKLEELNEHPWFRFAEGVQKSRTSPVELDQFSHENPGELKKCKSMISCGIHNTASKLLDNFK